jgi:ADP-ribosylglycohydrolase
MAANQQQAAARCVLAASGAMVECQVRDPQDAVVDLVNHQVATGMVAAGIVDIQHLVTEVDPQLAKALSLDQDIGIDRRETLHVLTGMSRR